MNPELKSRREYSRPEYNVGDLVECVDNTVFAKGTTCYVRKLYQGYSATAPDRSAWYVIVSAKPYSVYSGGMYAWRFKPFVTTRDILNNPEKYKNELFRLIRQTTT